MSYKVIEKKFVEEINSNVTVYEHDKTKARVMTFENDDPNKVFSIGFRTPPINDCGLTHILEHSVLCGSKKYPLKDPFVELLKGSLNTYLNAFTFPDKTMYPVASLNDKDFNNLMGVYLDAVFYPNIYTNPYIFMQEGWHYELNDKNDDIKINGVVYNEMKGAYSEPLGVISRYIMHSLFPDNAYGFESGGDPREIPNLSYEDFKMFHSKYYHPSNSYIMIYGNCNMEEKMKFIEDEYLNNFAYDDFDTSIKPSKANGLVREEYYYNAASDDGKKDFLSYNVVLPFPSDMKKMIAFDILIECLFTSVGAPLKDLIIKSGICEDVEVAVETDIMTPYLSIVAIGASKDDEEKFINLIEDGLKNVKVDKESILASLNYREFKTREAKGDGPKGLRYMIAAMSTWLYDDKMPYQALESLAYYADLRDELKGDYFENLIYEGILNNSHKSYVRLLPKTTLNQEEDLKLSEKLKEYKDSLSEEQINALIEETKALKLYQETPDTKEAIDTLPKLKLSDLSKEPLKLNIEQIDGYDFKVLYSNYFTNSIGYIDYLFDISDFDVKHLKYAKLLAKVIALVNTKNHSYAELSKLTRLNTGGYYTIIKTIERIDGEVKVFFDLKGSALAGHLSDLNDLIKDTIYNSIYDKTRIKELISEFKSEMESQIPGVGHVVAATRAASYASKAHFYSDLLDGVGQLDFIEGLASNYDKYADEIINNLYEVCGLIFNKNRMIFDFTSDEVIKDSVLLEAKRFYETLPNDNVRLNNDIELIRKNEALKAPYGVNYMAQYGKFGGVYDGALAVLRNAISLDYMWQNIRVLGGAYGATIAISDTGHVILATYRDPNTKRSLDIFKNLPEFVSNLKPSAEDLLKYKIGAIGALDDTYHVSTIGAMALAELLSGRTYELKKQRRIRIIECKSQDLRMFASGIAAALEENNICGIVSAKNYDEVKDIFDNTRELICKGE